MEPLARLFGSPARLKLLRLFLFNDDSVFTTTDALFRARVPKEAGRKELNLLLAAGIIRKKSGKGKSGLTADHRFQHYAALQQFLRDTSDISDTYIAATLKKAGAFRVVALSGLFTGAIESKVDLLVVADKIEEKPLAHAVHALEAELGRELRYAAFTTDQFRYRLGVYDRLLRDVFDFPNRIAVDKLGLAKKS